MWLQARSFYVEHVDELEDYWQGPWMTIGKVLEDPCPIAALSECWYRSLCQVVPCNYKYVLTHRAANGLEVCAREAEPNAFKWMNGLFVCE